MSRANRWTDDHEFYARIAAEHRSDSTPLGVICGICITLVVFVLFVALLTQCVKLVMH